MPDNWRDHSQPPSEGFTKLSDDLYSVFFTDRNGEPESHPVLWHWCEPKNEEAAAYCRKGTAPHWCPWGTAAHTVVQREPLTLTPSVYWPGCCGMHGFVTDGVYRGV
jgi:hypothetical protein